MRRHKPPPGLLNDEADIFPEAQDVAAETPTESDPQTETETADAPVPVKVKRGRKKRQQETDDGSVIEPMPQPEPESPRRRRATLTKIELEEMLEKLQSAETSKSIPGTIYMMVGRVIPELQALLYRMGKDGVTEIR